MCNIEDDLNDSQTEHRNQTSACIFEGYIVGKEIKFIFGLHNSKIFTYANTTYENDSDIHIVENCTFKENVNICMYAGEIEFKNCTFEKELVVIGNDQNNLSKTPSLKVVGGSISHLKINGTILKANIYIEMQNYKDEVDIVKLSIIDVVFKENFELHKCKINEIKIVDVDFEKLVDFNEITINPKADKVTNFEEIIFKKLALFDKCEFNQKVEFKYVIFESFSHFRNSCFKKGLNLDYCSHDKEMNFFGVKELDTPASKAKTSQETYRIIKHNFEELNNRIEANKYHSLELEKRQEELENGKWNDDYIEYIPLFFNYTFSRFSSNWFLVVLTIIFATMLNTSLLLLSSKMDVKDFFIGLGVLFILLPSVNLWLSRLCTLSTHKWIQEFSNMLYYVIYLTVLFVGLNFIICCMWSSQSFASIALQNLNLVSGLEPYEKLLKEENITGTQVAIVLFNKVFLGYLYYLFLTSIRKDTRK